MLEDTTLETANGECLPALRMFVKRCRTLPSNVWSLLLSSRPYSWMFEFRRVERRRRVLLNSLLGENKQCKNHKLSNTFKKDGKRAVISSRLGVSVFVNSYPLKQQRPWPSLPASVSAVFLIFYCDRFLAALISRFTSFVLRVTSSGSRPRMAFSFKSFRRGFM